MLQPWVAPAPAHTPVRAHSGVPIHRQPAMRLWVPHHRDYGRGPFVAGGSGWGGTNCQPEGGGLPSPVKRMPHAPRPRKQGEVSPVNKRVGGWWTGNHTPQGATGDTGTVQATPGVCSACTGSLYPGQRGFWSLGKWGKWGGGDGGKWGGEWGEMGGNGEKWREMGGTWRKLRKMGGNRGEMGGGKGGEWGNIGRNTRDVGCGGF